MKRTVGIRRYLLLQISTDLHNRMAEVEKLREMVRSAEAADRGRETAQPAALQLVSHELRV
jgi:hypothetical protein